MYGVQWFYNIIRYIIIFTIIYKVMAIRSIWQMSFRSTQRDKKTKTKHTGRKNFSKLNIIRTYSQSVKLKNNPPHTCGYPDARRLKSK